MAIQDIGMFLPSESNYKIPGAYDEALRAEAAKRAQYLSLMDQFYEQLNESQRQFNETLGFKTTTRDLELAHSKWKVEQEIGIQEKELVQRGKQFSEDLALRNKMLEADTEYKQESLDVERMKINAARPMNYLGTSPAEKSMNMAMDMVKQLTGGSSKGAQPSTQRDSLGILQSGRVSLTAGDEALALSRAAKYLRDTRGSEGWSSTDWG